jgi:hypothetical protein
LLISFHVRFALKLASMKKNRSVVMRSGPFRTLMAAGVILGGLSVAQVGAQPSAQPGPQPSTQPNPMPPTQPPATAGMGATSAPASAPVVPINTSTPRGALKTLLTAIQTGDPQGIKKVIHTSTPVEEKMVDALAHRALAENNFRQAAVKAFGADAAKQLVGDAEASNVVNMSQLDAAAETVDGDSAIVNSNSAGGEPVKLSKINGQWQIPASEFSKATDPTKIQQNIEDMNFAANLIDQFAGDVSGGKYKTATEAGESIQLQMRAAMEKYAMQRAGGATTTPAPASTSPNSGPG